MEKAATKKRKQKRVNYVPLFLMLLPGMIYLIINNYLPMYGITIAFKIWTTPKEFGVVLEWGLKKL